VQCESSFAQERQKQAVAEQQRDKGSEAESKDFIVSQGITKPQTGPGSKSNQLKKDG